MKRSDKSIIQTLTIRERQIIATFSRGGCVAYLRQSSKDKLESLGLDVQTEQPIHDAKNHYALILDEFRKRAEKLGLA